MIDLNEIGPGDQVGLLDRSGNQARGVVIRRGVMLAIGALGTAIEFARVNSNGTTVSANPGVRVIEHTPTLTGGAA